MQEFWKRVNLFLENLKKILQIFLENLWLIAEILEKIWGNANSNFLVPLTLLAPSTVKLMNYETILAAKIENTVPQTPKNNYIGGKYGLKGQMWARRLEFRFDSLYWR